MIYPRPNDILKTIDATIVSKVQPSLNDLTSMSAMATIRHLIRLVSVQIEHEGAILTEDIARTRPLLQQVEEYFRSVGDIAHAGAARAAREKDAEVTGYRNNDALAQEAAGLRECVYQSLKALQALRPAQGGTDAYKAIRKAIRDYTVWQVEQEDRLIRPAFFGQGPRR